MNEPRDRIYVDVERRPKEPAPRKPKKLSKRQKAMRVLVTTFVILVLALVACGVVIAVNLSQIWAKPDVDDNAADLHEEAEDDVAGLPEVSFEQGKVTAIPKRRAKWTY